jgi:uncharacterized Zn finger protein
MMNQQQQQQQQLLLEQIMRDGTDVLCEECGSRFFKKAIIIKKMSKILLASPEDEYFHFPVVQCSECGHVNKDFEIKK